MCLAKPQTPPPTRLPPPPPPPPSATPMSPVIDQMTKDRLLLGTSRPRGGLQSLTLPMGNAPTRSSGLNVAQG